MSSVDSSMVSDSSAWSEFFEMSAASTYTMNFMNEMASSSASTGPWKSVRDSLFSSVTAASDPSTVLYTRAATPSTPSVLNVTLNLTV